MKLWFYLKTKSVMSNTEVRRAAVRLSMSPFLWLTSCPSCNAYRTFVFSPTTSYEGFAGELRRSPHSPHQNISFSERPYRMAVGLPKVYRSASIDSAFQSHVSGLLPRFGHYGCCLSGRGTGFLFACALISHKEHSSLFPE